MKIIAFLIQFFFLSRFLGASDIETCTDVLQKYTIRGELHLDCSDDYVLYDLYELISNKSEAHPLWFENKEAPLVPRFFITWSSNVKDGHAQLPQENESGGVLEFRDATVKDILMRVSKARGRKLIDLESGWFLGASDMQVPKLDAIITEKQILSARGHLDYPLPISSDAELREASPADVRKFINDYLKRTAHRDPTFRKCAFQVKEGVPTEVPATKRVLSGIGKFHYLELLYSYGLAFDRKFEWSSETELLDLKR